MIRKLPSSKSAPPTRKPRKLRERAVTYKTRQRGRSRPIRYPPIPIKPNEWDKYRGETIALADGKILAHGLDLDHVLQEVWEKYGKKPSQVGLLKVPKARHKLL
ncbi:MAG: hypothetical protein HY327_00980 [Chloroflexi bacterium]|nr:hypothetical protein [Chloroflexota bacterium]